uniref:Nesprin-1 n=1 Tax=Caenorhabditis tropicalis TaxID=1561998 RepID=A0A1I7UQL6_9PELO
MTECCTFGSRMYFDKLHQHGALDNSRPSESLLSSTSSLGSHWKKVDSTKSNISSISSLSTDIPSKPVTLSAISSFSSNSTVVPSLHSIGNTQEDDLSSTSVSSESDASSNQTMRSLVEDTETREERQCISLQIQGFQELNTTLDQSIVELSDSRRQKEIECEEIFEEGTAVWKKLDDYVDCLEESVRVATLGFDEKSGKLSETIRQASTTFKKKEKIEEFVRNNEEILETNLKTLKIISENEKSVNRLRQTLGMPNMEIPPLTVFEQEDERVEQVFRSLVNLVRSMDLNKNERADLEHAIQKIEKDPSLEGKNKCELITRYLFITMNNWKKSNDKSTTYSSDFNSDEWKSIGSIDSRSDVLGENVIESSSFALTNSSIDDSNLSDLEGNLRSSSIIRAVEGLKQVYECSYLNTESIYSGWSSESAGLSSCQSLREPATLSSYVYTPTVGESTLSSLSTTSMPNQTFEIAPENMKTAYSVGESVIGCPPRSIGEKSLPQSATGTRTHSISSRNFSNDSLIDSLIGEDLHTAKDDSVSIPLLDALHNSARKCGVDVSDLMTAISSSSESLSDTQSSHHSSQFQSIH